MLANNIFSPLIGELGAPPDCCGAAVFVHTAPEQTCWQAPAQPASPLTRSFSFTSKYHNSTGLFQKALKVDCSCTSGWTSVEDTVAKSIWFASLSRAADAPLSQFLIVNCANKPIGSIVILHLNEFSSPPFKNTFVIFQLCPPDYFHFSSNMLES